MTYKRFHFESIGQLKLPKKMKVVSELLPGGFFITRDDNGLTVNRIEDVKGNTRPIGEPGNWHGFNEALTAVRAMQDVLVRQS